MDPEFYELLNDSVVIRYRTADDTHGNPTYGSATVTRARVDAHAITRSGAVQHDNLPALPATEYTVYMDLLDTVPGVQDKLFVFGDEAWITNVVVHHDENGPSHYIVSASKTVEL